jgi:hypothetical protein
MRQTNYLSRRANIVCVLLALIGSTAVIKHPEWFGGTSEIVTRVDTLAAPVTQMTP